MRGLFLANDHGLVVNSVCLQLSQMNIQEYIDNVARRYALGNATEHTFRGDLQSLIESG